MNYIKTLSFLLCFAVIHSSIHANCINTSDVYSVSDKGDVYSVSDKGDVYSVSDKGCFMHDKVFHSSNVCKVACRLGCIYCQIKYVECKRIENDLSASSDRHKLFGPIHQYKCVCEVKA